EKNSKPSTDNYSSLYSKYSSFDFFEHLFTSYFVNLNDIRSDKLKIWIKGSVSIFFLVVKVFQKFNYGENIIDSWRSSRNVVYWR
ncbi:MAG: hypothetical protein KKD21_01425, partial [Proteobacteria bacterium]|nr:hypothetical protein [Pseudomonadota bacterium]MBU1695690.1 hypothetical protein [Pseudomonadota bacterium]